MIPAVPARAVAVALALVLATAVATVAVRLRSGPEQVPPTAATAPGAAPPRPTAGTPTPAPTPTPQLTSPPTSPPPSPSTSPPSTPTSPAPAPTATAGPPPRPKPGAAVREALAERVLAPPGSPRRLADDEEGIGPLDAASVAALDDGSARDRAAAARRLEELGFEQALGRGWTAGRRRYVLVVHRFATPAGADQLVSDVSARLPGRAFRSRTVPEAVASSTRSVLYWQERALFARGRYAYRLTFLSPQEDFGHRTIDRLLKRQAAHAARLDP